VSRARPPGSKAAGGDTEPPALGREPPSRAPHPVLGLDSYASEREPAAHRPKAPAIDPTGSEADTGELFYGHDLAYVHDAAFGELARGAARTLLRQLARAGIERGLVVDLGAGSGITAAMVTDAGYEVLGVELSDDMVEIAQRRAPAARFIQASLLDADLPTSVAVTAIGECLNYAADQRVGREQLAQLFGRVHRALRPGGMFLLDVAEPGRERRTPRRAWSEGPDWLLCLEATEESDPPLLRRRITTFRESAGAWRRSDELHSLRLYPREDVLGDLAGAGFRSRLLASYGPAWRFRRGHAGVLATKPSE
jgi:SAM-dependent methyltransferase